MEEIQKYNRCNIAKQSVKRHYHKTTCQRLALIEFEQLHRPLALCLQHNIGKLRVVVKIYDPTRDAIQTTWRGLIKN